MSNHNSVDRPAFDRTQFARQSGVDVEPTESTIELGVDQYENELYSMALMFRRDVRREAIVGETLDRVSGAEADGCYDQ